MLARYLVPQKSVAEKKRSGSVPVDEHHPDARVVFAYLSKERSPHVESQLRHALHAGYKNL